MGSNNMSTGSIRHPGRQPEQRIRSMPSSPPRYPIQLLPETSSHSARWKAGSLMALGLLLLLLLAYWMISQPFFVRSILFPKIEEALGARLEADIIEFGPFSSLSATRSCCDPPMGKLWFKFRTSGSNMIGSPVCREWWLLKKCLIENCKSRRR